jgi:hypothetical protein
MLLRGERITEIAMKMLQIVSGDGARLYSAMIKKQAEIRRGGRGTFSRAGARWTHVRYRGSINMKPTGDGLSARIKSPDDGDEARLLSSFLGWLDRHFGERLSSINIQYQKAAARTGRRR